MIVLNIGHNPGFKVDFIKPVKRLIDLSKKYNIKLVISLEANSIELIHPLLLERHEKLRELAQRNGIKVLDFHRYINSNPQKDSGILWWDSVHLTDWGHQVAAEFFVEKLF